MGNAILTGALWTISRNSHCGTICPILTGYVFRGICLLTGHCDKQTKFISSGINFIFSSSHHGINVHCIMRYISNSEREVQVVRFDDVDGFLKQEQLIVLGDGGYRGTGCVMAHQLVKLYPLQACPRMCLIGWNVMVSQSVWRGFNLNSWWTRTAVATVAKYDHWFEITSWCGVTSQAGLLLGGVMSRQLISLA